MKYPKILAFSITVLALLFSFSSHAQEATKTETAEWVNGTFKSYQVGPVTGSAAEEILSGKDMTEILAATFSYHIRIEEGQCIIFERDESKITSKCCGGGAVRDYKWFYKFNFSDLTRVEIVTDVLGVTRDLTYFSDMVELKQEPELTALKISTYNSQPKISKYRIFVNKQYDILTVIQKLDLKKIYENQVANEQILLVNELSSANDYVQVDPVNGISSFYLLLENDLAIRLSKALEHYTKLCGGKKEKF